MNPSENLDPVTSTSKFKKLIVPGIIIIVIVVLGLVIFGGKSDDQGAALFKGVTKTQQQLTPGAMIQVSTATPLNCLVGSTAPQIKVMSPNGGETYQAGQQITVTWSTCNIPATGNAVAITVRGDNGGFPGSAIQFYDTGYTGSNTGTAVVTLPTQVNNSFMQYGLHFKVEVTVEGYGSDRSDNLFTINQNLTAACNGLTVDNYAEVVYDPTETTFIVNSSGQGGGSPGYRNPFVESGKTVVSPFIVYNSACDLYLKKIDLSLLSPVGVPSISATYKVRDAFNGNILATAVVPFNTSPKTVTLDLSANPITVPALQNRKFVIEVSNLAFPVLAQGVNVVPAFTFGIKDVVMEHALNGDAIVHKNYKSWIPVINLK